jgi:hypothetical protein
VANRRNVFLAAEFEFDGYGLAGPADPPDGGERPEPGDLAHIIEVEFLSVEGLRAETFCNDDSGSDLVEN